jgi:methylated-DNA-[protein]-cysteine S-methyltransferase
MTAEWTIYESPLGPLTVEGGPAGIARVHFPERSPNRSEDTRRPMAGTIEQLEEYFAGQRSVFEVTLDLRGSPLQRLVWAGLQRIPYGTTISYGELAGRIEEAAFPAGLAPYQRVRAAAAAVGQTPTPILVPCHRVIGADGSLTGYGGGLPRKQALLDLERGVAAEERPASGRQAPQLSLL